MAVATDTPVQFPPGNWLLAHDDADPSTPSTIEIFHLSITKDPSDVINGTDLIVTVTAGPSSTSLSLTESPDPGQLPEVSAAGADVAFAQYTASNPGSLSNVVAHVTYGGLTVDYQIEP